MITNNWHALHEYFLITIEPLNCHIDRTIQQVCTSFQLSHRVFLGLSAWIIHVQRKCLFLWTLQTIHWLIFLHVQADHDGRKQFLRSMQKILWSREVMQRKPRKSFLKLSLRKHPFLLALRPLGMFREEERLRLSSRNSILMMQINVYIINPVVMGFQIQNCPILHVFWSILVKCCVHLPTSSGSKTQRLLLENSIFHKYWLFC